MIIISLTVLSILLITFRILRGESIRDIHREIKALKAQEVPHYFLKSLKIVFTFKGPGFKKRHQTETPYQDSQRDGGASNGEEQYRKPEVSSDDTHHNGDDTEETKQQIE